jgi:hypothetical protein
MVTAEAYVAGRQRRERRGSHIALAIVAGLIGAVAISLIAGSRRSSTVVDRYFDTAPGYDVLVGAASLNREQLLAVDGVELVAPSAYLALDVVDDGGKPSSVDGLIVDFSQPDGTRQVIRGALPGADEYAVAVDESFPAVFGVDVGDTVRVRMYAPDQLDEVTAGVYDPRGPTYDFTVAAIGRVPQVIAQDETRSPRHAGTTPSGMLVPIEFWNDHHNEFLDFGLAYDIKLSDGAGGIPDFVATVRGLAGDDELFVEPVEDAARRTAIEAPVGLESRALLILGIATAIAGLTVVLLLTRNDNRRHHRDAIALTSLGMTSRQRALTSVLRVLPAAGCAGLLAGGVAYGLSRQFPIGIGRLVEPSPGWRFDQLVVIIGAGVVAGVVAGCAALTVPRTRAKPVSGRGAAAWAWTRRAGVPSDAVIGSQLAFGDTGRGRNTVWPGVAAGAFVIAALGATSIWVAGVDSLYQEPGRHGFPWDIAIGNSNFELSDQTLARIAADPRIETSTVTSYGQAMLNGTSVELLVFDPAGTAPPVIVDGRLPDGDHEIALGVRLMRQLGVDLGDTVSLSVADGDFVAGSAPVDVALSVVGSTLAPALGESDLSTAGATTFAAIEAAGGAAPPKYVVARLAGADPQRTVDDISHEFSEEMITDVVPSQIVNLHRVRTVPELGIALAVVLALVVLVSTVVASVRANRMQLAVFGALGMTRRQSGRARAWLGTVVSVSLLVIGIPGALLLGSVVWSHVSDDLGVVPGAATPWRLLGLVTTLFVAGGIVSATSVDTRHRRNHLATQLHTE